MYDGGDIGDVDGVWWWWCKWWCMMMMMKMMVTVMIDVKGGDH
jgi:hypothetical protein